MMLWAKFVIILVIALVILLALLLAACSRQVGRRRRLVWGGRTGGDAHPGGQERPDGQGLSAPLTVSWQKHKTWVDLEKDQNDLAEYRRAAQYARQNYDAFDWTGVLELLRPRLSEREPVYLTAGLLDDWKPGDPLRLVPRTSPVEACLPEKEERPPALAAIHTHPLEDTAMTPRNAFPTSADWVNALISDSSGLESVHAVVSEYGVVVYGTTHARKTFNDEERAEYSSAEHQLGVASFLASEHGWGPHTVDDVMGGLRSLGLFCYIALETQHIPRNTYRFAPDSVMYDRIRAIRDTLEIVRKSGRHI